jgi:hypothetical protein
MSEARPPDGPPSGTDPPTESEPQYWLDSHRSHNLIVGGLVVACVALVVGDFAYDQHGHFEYEEWNGFHAIFGFLAYVGIVQTAKILREFVQRAEDHYGE